MEEISQIYYEILDNFGNKALKNNDKNKKKKKNKEINIQEVEFKGYKIYFGKNNIQNDYLTFNLASREDLWFHAQKLHGSHVVIKNNGEEIPEEVIYEAGKIAKENSKGKNSNVVPIDYCKIKFVKRSQNRKLGMVNYSNFNTILVK